MFAYQNIRQLGVKCSCLIYNLFHKINTLNQKLVYPSFVTAGPKLSQRHFSKIFEIYVQYEGDAQKV
jgi:hypothetical protein